MSRIGKKIIAIPEKTDVTIGEGKVTVKGPQGEISREFPMQIEVKKEGSTITVAPAKNTKDLSPLWGTVAAHIINMIEGVNKPFQKKLVVEGIGYKADLKGEELVMALGFSHLVKMKVPKGLKVTIEKGIITIVGINKDLVGQFAASIREHKKPEPYKGKGIHYEDEVVRRKQGKKSV